MPRKNDRSREIDLKLASATAGGDPPSGVVPPTAAPAIPNQPAPTGLAVASNTILFSAVTPMALVGLTWNAPPGTPPAFYVVEYATNSTFTTNLQRVHAYQTSAGIELPANTLYYFRVQGVTNFVASAYSSTVSVTTAADSTAAGQPTSIASDWSGADLVITWVNPSSANLRDVEVRIWNSSGKTVLYHTGYNSAGRYTWTIEQQRIDTSGSLDPSVFFELRSRTWAGTLGTAPAGSTVTNATPSAPSAVSFIQAPGSITITVTATPPADFAAYRYRLIQTSPSASDVTWDSPSALGSYSIYAQATYQVGCRVLDVFGQLSSETLSSATVVDSLTISALRADVIYSDNDGNSDATLHVKLSDGVLTSGGQTYSTTGTWNKWVRAERPNLDRYRTVTLSMTPASGTSTWYLRLSNDGSTWTYYAGPVTSSRILTLVADAAAAQAAAVSAGTLGGQTTSRVELPSNVEARFVEVWMRNAGPANTRLDEFYPRRVVEADDIKVQNLSGISADLGTMTAGTITGATIQTAASGARIELTSANGLRSYDSGNVLQAQIRTSDGQMYFANGDVRLGSFGMRLIVPTSAYQYSSAYQFYETSGSTVNAALQSYKSAFANELNLVANAYNTCQSDITIESKSGSSSAATASLSASGNSGTSIASVVLTGASSGTTSTVDVAGELRVNYSINGSGSPYIRNTNAGSSAYGTLYIGNNTDVTSGIIRNSSANAGYAGANSLSLIHVGAYPIGFVTNNTLRMSISGAGDVGIGVAPISTYRCTIYGANTSAANYALVVRNSAAANMMYVENNGTLWANVAWTISDANEKDEIEDLDLTAIDILDNLRVRRYKRTISGEHELGFIAQEVQQAYPGMVKAGMDGVLGIRTGDILALLVAAFKREKAVVRNLRQRIIALETA